MIDYLNLSSGLEWANEIENYKLVRIQSSNFESNKKWSAILDLDYQFLIDAAMIGVTLRDCGSRSGPLSRAQWMGIPWILWAYAKSNKGSLPDVTIRNTNCFKDFESFYNFGESDRIRKKAKNKLRYVSRLTGAKTLVINNMGKASTLDGNMEELAKVGGFR